MVSIRGAILLAASVTLLPALGCTWVQLTEAGSGVRMLGPEAAPACEKIGTVRSTTADSVGIFTRSDVKVREELESLARNQAAERGGNAIAPRGPITAAGTQEFTIYRCADS